MSDTAKATSEKLHSIHVRLDEARYQELKVYAARNSKTVQTILSEYIDSLNSKIVQTILAEYIDSLNSQR